MLHNKAQKQQLQRKSRTIPTFEKLVKLEYQDSKTDKILDVQLMKNLTIGCTLLTRKNLFQFDDYLTRDNQ